MLLSKSSFIDSSLSSDSSSDSEYYDNLAVPNQFDNLRRKSKSFIFDGFIQKQEQLVQPPPDTAMMNKSHTNIIGKNFPLLKLSLEPKAKNSKLHTVNKTNPEIYKSFLFQIKSFYNKGSDNHKKLSKKSMEIIKKVIQLENSLLFHF
jgi:hypothetical protein